METCNQHFQAVRIVVCMCALRRQKNSRIRRKVIQRTCVSIARPSYRAREKERRMVDTRTLSTLTLSLSVLLRV